EVVGPEEAALQQILAQTDDLFVAERRRTRIFDLDERALEQRIVCRADDEMVGFAAVLAADAGLGQFGEPNREVDVGVRIVGPPALAAVLPADLLVEQAAEVKTA